MDGTGWFLPRREALSAKISDIVRKVEELEHDLDKVKRWFSEIEERDFWETPERWEAEKLIEEPEASVFAFFVDLR